MGRLSRAEAHRLLTTAGDHAELFLGTGKSPWLQASITTTAEHDVAVDSVNAARSALTALRSALRDPKASALVPVVSRSDLSILDSILARVVDVLERCAPEVFGAEAEAVLTALVPATSGAFARFWAWLTNGRYRAAIRRARSWSRIQVGLRALHGELTAARALLQEWKQVTTRTAPPPGREEPWTAVRKAVGALESAIGRAAAHLPPDVMTTADLGELERILAALDADRQTAMKLPAIVDLRRRAEALGLGDLMAEMKELGLEAGQWAEYFDAAWAESAVAAYYRREPRLAMFSGRAQDRLVEEFRRLDKDRLALAPRRVLRRHAERLLSVRNAHPEQDAILRRESTKKSRNKPLRRLLREAPEALTALFPCWMASPLSVSHYLPPSQRLFDVVIFDEASQVVPEDAVTALLRAESAVVAGDRHQLPPTTFFADHGDDAPDGESDGATDGFESLLDVMSSFLETWNLDWHYRSRDERLIAFSNHHVYGRRLITFPSSRVAGAVSMVHVPWRPGTGAGQDASGSDEVCRVVEVVREHVRADPSMSLGIITMGIPHMQRIEAALDAAMVQDPLLEQFFEGRFCEKPFIKNLERVQGDERDAIIVSIGYTKDSSGKLPLSFGPINYEAGYRRLNVAFTRARQRMTLVASFTHRDLDPERIRGKRGLEMLRGYLEFASQGGERLDDRGITAFPVNAFEADVQDTLARAGIECIPQWGASSYRLDLAAKHPSRPGELVLAIECDGASYHSAKTARDRDRLRQEHLQALGWRFHRIWSTDWFRDKEAEVVRARDAFRRAVDWSDAEEEKRRMPKPVASALPPEMSPPSTMSSPVSVEEGPAPRRLPNPRLPRRDSIAEYSRRELDDLMRWIRSDGLLRSDAELIDEAMRELPFRRRGQRIVAALQDAVDRTRGGE